MEERLLIGIDGGGTHSTAVAASPEGRVVAVVYGEGLNFHNIGVPLVRARLEDMVARLREKCGGAEVEKVCVGMSALDEAADEATLQRFAGGSLSREQLDLQSDAYIALMGFTRGEPGVIAICGTGSMLLMMDKAGNQHVSGGWGYLLRDAGSGYTLAREAVLAVIDEAEGVGPATALTADAPGYFQAQTLREVINCIYAPGFTPAQMAGFARHVLSRAQEGDQVALGVVEKNMHDLARQAARLMQSEPLAKRVGLYGGVFEHSPLARECFAGELERLIPGAQASMLDCPPELGAVIHLMKQSGILTDQALTLMKNSYKEIKP